MDLSFDDSKRRRTTLASPNLVDLPLTSIADYLPSTNRLLLAVALTASSLKDIGWNNAKLSTASKAVLASKEYWELDFAEIREFAGDPSDEDLRTLLLNIDAKNTLRTLRMEGCTRIVGRGLEPLRGSTVLQQLSLPHRFSNGVENALSIDIVIPIVFSMVNGRDNPLDHVQLLETLGDHSNKSEKARTDQALRSELAKVDELLSSEGSDYRICSMCYSLVTFIDRCENCNLQFCEYCNGHYASEEEFAICDTCNSRYCSVCAQLDDVDSAMGCDRWDRYCSSCCCERKHCFGCIEGQLNPCGECFVLHRQRIIARHQAQLAEIAQLRQQIDQLQMNDD